MKAQRALVVGASGQVGRQLAAVLGADHCVAAGRHCGEDGVRLDLADLAARPDLADPVLDGCAADAIYCCGGMTDVEGCESAETAAYLVNCFGPAALAKASARRGLPFVYFSTEYVFDGQAGPYDEGARPAPISVYGVSKREGESAIQSVHPGALILRTTVVYGPDPGGKNFLCGLRRNLLAGKPMSVAADQISTPTYNRDLAQAAVALADAGASGIFHVCGPERLSRYQFACRAAALMGLDTSPIRGVATGELRQRAPRPLNAGLSSSRLPAVLPGLQMRGLEQSIPHWMASGDLP